jgi:hypothetical protein
MSATSSTDRAVVDPESCQLGANDPVLTLGLAATPLTIQFLWLREAMRSLIGLGKKGRLRRRPAHDRWMSFAQLRTHTAHCSPVLIAPFDQFIAKA